jgi:hypothetical protein
MRRELTSCVRIQAVSSVATMCDFCGKELLVVAAFDIYPVNEDNPAVFVENA